MLRGIESLGFCYNDKQEEILFQWLNTQGEGRFYARSNDKKGLVNFPGGGKMNHRHIAMDATPVLRALKQARRHSSQARYLYRLLCVLLVADGHACSKIAELLGVSLRSVERWVRYYDEFGCSGLRDDYKSGRTSRLTHEQLGQLARDVSRHPRLLGYLNAAWTGSLLQRHIEQRFGVALGLRQCQRILRRLIL
jgi:transposase